MDSKTALMVICGIIFGAIAMDYYNRLMAKKLNYTKRSGLFKYTAEELI